MSTYASILVGSPVLFFIESRKSHDQPLAGELQLLEFLQMHIKYRADFIFTIAHRNHSIPFFFPQLTDISLRILRTLNKFT